MHGKIFPSYDKKKNVQICLIALTPFTTSCQFQQPLANFTTSYCCYIHFYNWNTCPANASIKH